MTEYYYNDQHKAIYDSCIERTGDKKAWVREDRERLSCFYLIALMCAIAPNHKPENFYDFKSNSIISESINRPEITGTTARILRLAYILYNSFPDGEPNNGINDIFTYRDEYAPFKLEALRIRYDITRLEDQERGES